MRYEARAARLVQVLVVPLVLGVLPHAASAQGETGNVCVRDYRGGAVCTANDVRIEALTVVSVVEDCVSGTPGEAEIVFEALISAAGSPNRYDIGLFLAQDGGSARDGDSCYHDFLSGALTATPTYGDKNTDTILDLTDGPWWDGGGDGDLCGDIESNTQLFKTLPALRFACIDNNGDGSADVAVCTSWDNNTGSACNSVVDAFPGTNSKCSCSGVELGIAPEPAITVLKTPANQNVLAGGTANFTFTVTSKTTISNVVVTDPDCDAAPAFTGGDTNNDTILTPDETWSYTCSKTGVLASFTNTVTATGSGPLGAVNDTDTANVTVSTATMTLAKSGVLNDGGDGVVDAGDSIAYTFTVANTGSVALTNVAVTDPLPGLSAITCPSGNPIPSLAVAASENCTATLVLSQADVDSGQIDNTATGTSNEVGAVQDSESIPLPAGPALTLVKTGALDVGGDGVANAGDLIDYTFQVTNAGNVTITAIGVSDPMIAPITCPGGNPIPSLAPGASVVCTGSYAITQADVDAGVKNNTADAAGQDPGGNPVSDTDSHSEPIAQAPALTLVKTGTFNDDVTTNGVAEVGETVGYTFDVTNTGNVTLTNVGVTDPLIGTVTCPGGNPIPSLAPGASAQCTGSYTLVLADINNGQVTNTATADADQATPVEDMDTVPLAQAPAIGVAKRVSATSDLGGGQFDVALAFVVENLGTVDLTNVQVSDDLTATFPAPVTFAVQAGPTAGGTLAANGGFNGAGDQNLLNAGASSLAVGATGTITFTVRITLNGASGPFSNTAAATASSPAGPVSDTSDDGTDPDPDGDGNPDEQGENDPTPIPVNVIAAPLLDATKSSTFDTTNQDNDGSGTLTAGDDLTYTVVLTNNGAGDALAVFFDDTPDANTALVVGTVTTTQGVVATGNTVGDTAVAVDVGTLAGGGGSVTITFEVTLNDPLPPAVVQIVNQGVVSASNVPPLFTDDPDTPPSGDPTVDPVAAPGPGPAAIPTLSSWVLFLLSILVGAAALRVLRS